MKRFLISAMGLFCFSSAFAASEIVNSFDLGGPYYHAGSIAVAAYPHWNSVVMGPIPAVLGALANGTHSGTKIEPALKVVAVVEEDKPAHALMIAQSEYDDIAGDPATKLPGQNLLLTPLSTGQMYAERCLAGWNLTLDQMKVIEAEEAGVREGFRAKTANVGFVWSSFTYLAENDSAKARALDCLKLTDLEIPTFIVARSDLLNETDPDRLRANRKQIGMYVAKFLGAWADAKSKPTDSAKKLVLTYAKEGIKVTDIQAQTELEARRPLGLADQQTSFTAPADGIAPLATSLDTIMDFMVASGTLKAADKPAAMDLLDRSILDFIAVDPVLGPIARGEK